MISEENIMYGGMAEDIMAPMLLVPNFDKIYVVSLFDSAFSKKGTWKSQKDDIKRILKNGNDKNTHRKYIRDKYPDKKGEQKVIFHLRGKSKILQEEDVDNRWYLKFEYMDNIRKLIYFHDTNFLKDWPSEIQNITHVMFMGSFSFNVGSDIDFVDMKRDYLKLFKMFKERCTTPMYLYALSFNHPHFEKKLCVKCGTSVKGDKINVLKLQDKKSKGNIKLICGLK